MSTGSATLAAADAPIKLHPENPHYFLFRGQPTVLVTATEHYGSVLNSDFDYLTYLNTLAKDGLNLTRAVNGTLVESVTTGQWRGGRQNPLAPREGRLLVPWARSHTPGYYFGGNKFDLDRWDDNYFSRLKDFVRAAGERGIVVELNLFYVQYGLGDKSDVGSWILNPLYIGNNVNGVGNVPWHQVNTLADKQLLDRQLALVRKTLTELNEFDNVYYELCDEPYFSGASPREVDAWQRRLIDEFLATERPLPNKHMIAWNYSNLYAEVKDPHPAVSVFNFHRAFPPAAAPLNWRHGRALAFDETIAGSNARQKRQEAWAWMFSGGAVFDHLDWSFATDDPTGSGQVEQSDGRWDGRALRCQLGILKTFLMDLDFLHLEPDRLIATQWPSTDAGTKGDLFALVDPGQEYALYLIGKPKNNLVRFVLDVPKGRYQINWLHPVSGEVESPAPHDHPGGRWTLTTPRFDEDIALRIKRVTE